MQTYDVTLTHKTPLLMHHDNIEWADKMELWNRVPANKKGSKAGDDRSPAFRWLGCIYHDGERMVLPVDNIMASIMGGAAQVPTGKGQGTFKSRSQSGIVPGEMFWPFLVNGQEVPIADFFANAEKRSFDEFQALAAKYGFTLFVKRARIGKAKHVRVRPRFDDWSASGTLMVTDDGITEEILRTILEQAGRLKGMADWRPGSPTPGSWGMYQSVVRKR
jgi:hypothetical protein